MIILTKILIIIILGNIITLGYDCHFKNRIVKDKTIKEIKTSFFIATFSAVSQMILTIYVVININLEFLFKG